MQYWLMKSEPDVWSIKQQKKAGKKGVAWDGVRNYQAANNLKAMKEGDLCFFYHSNIGKEIVGIVKVIKEAFIDKTDKKKRFVAVQVRFQEYLKYPISLEKIKKSKHKKIEIDIFEETGKKSLVKATGTLRIDTTKEFNYIEKGNILNYDYIADSFSLSFSKSTRLN